MSSASALIDAPLPMKSQTLAVLREYDDRIRQEAEAIRGFNNEEYVRRRETMVLGVGEDTGRLLHLLIKMRRPQLIVEFGTSFGYSTLWIADAAATVGARVITIELGAEKQLYAADMLTKAGLRDCVTFVCGDAVDAMATIQEGVDFVLIDLGKDVYIPAFDSVFPKLSASAIVCADNMLYPDYQVEAAKNYIQHVREIEGIESITVPVGSGVEVSVWQKGGDKNT